MASYYKVRKKGTGLFHLGRINHDYWNKKGKTWDTIGKLRTFLTYRMRDTYSPPNMGNWEIVEYVMIEQPPKEVHEVIKPERLLELLTK